FSTSGLTVGTHTVNAAYSGDNNFNSGTSANLLQTVNQDASTTTVTSSPNASVFGQTMNFTATVTDNSPGAWTPTGTVTFLDGGTSIGSGTLSGGSATFSTAGLTVGTHTVSVSYSGDTNFTASSGTLSGGQTVNAANTATTVVSDNNPSTLNQTVTFT